MSEVMQPIPLADEGEERRAENYWKIDVEVFAVVYIFVVVHCCRTKRISQQVLIIARRRGN